MLSPILSCKNVPDSFRFYVDVLGFAEGIQMKDESGIVNFAMVKLGKIEIMLGVIDGFVGAEDRSRVGLGIQLHIALMKWILMPSTKERRLLPPTSRARLKIVNGANEPLISKTPMATTTCSQNLL